MKTFWENNGEPVDGKYVAVVDTEDGRGTQRFIGETHKEVADKLLEAQMSATSKIAEQAKDLLARTPVEVAEPSAPSKKRPLDANERTEIARDMTDPLKAPEAIARVVEAAAGVPLSTLADRVQQQTEEEQAREAHAETRAFIDGTPEYLATPQNNAMLLNYMQDPDAFIPVLAARGVQADKVGGAMKITRTNFAIAFARLSGAALVAPKPEEAAPVAEPGPGALPAPVATTRPRGAVGSTGLRASDASAGGPATRPAKYTRAAVEAMSLAKYNQLLAEDAEFKAFIASLDIPAAAAR